MNNEARTGKIARLPQKLRDAVNRRLNDGQPAETLLAWLNAEPDARAVLKKQFAGALINKQNLSRWRTGGYQEWLRQRADAESFKELAQACKETQFKPFREQSDLLASLLSRELATVAKVLLEKDENPKKHWRRLREFLPVLAQLRRVDHQAIRLRRDQERWEMEDDAAEEAAAARDIAERKKRALAPLDALRERPLLAASFGRGRTAYELADHYLSIQKGIKFPPNDYHYAAPASHATSNQVTPNHAESNQKNDPPLGDPPSAEAPPPDNAAQAGPPSEDDPTKDEG